MLLYRKSPVFFIEDKKLHYYQKGDEVVLSQSGENPHLVTMHGAGWVHNKLVYQSSHLSQFKLDDVLTSVFGESHKGVLCTYVYSERESFIFPDPLGSSILFYYQKDRVFACSTDLQELVDVLNENGIILKKNLHFLTETVCTGNGGFFESSYEDIEALMPHRYLRICNGEVFFLKYRTESVIFEIPKFGIDEIYADINANILAILEKKDIKKISHITGGFDSRLVFSALIHNNISAKDHIAFLCNGNKKLVDKSVAMKLCGTFNQPMVNVPGILSNPNFADNLLRHTSGLSMQHPPIAKIRNELTIAGGFGENLRSFYSQALTGEAGIEQDLAKVIEKLYGSVLAIDEKSRFVSTNFYESFLARFKAKVAFALDNGLDFFAAIDYLYISVRNRYFLSQTSINYSNISPRVDPLYSVFGAGYALHMDAKSRQSNLLGLELMHSFSPACLALPFDRERITTEFRGKYPNFQPKEFSKASPKFVNHTPVALQTNDGLSTRHPTSTDIELANELGAPLWQVANLNNVQEKLRKFIDNIDRAELAQNFDPKYIGYLSRQPLRNRVHIRRLFNIYNILSWYYEG